MEIRHLTCISCPMGCPITVEMEDGQVVSVTGNTCKRGDNLREKGSDKSDPDCDFHHPGKRRN